MSVNEAVSLLIQYIQIDTSNPPGNEADAVEFFADIFRREGIEYKTYEPKPGRVSIRAVLRGSGKKGPVKPRGRSPFYPKTFQLKRSCPESQ